MAVPKLGKARQNFSDEALLELIHKQFKGRPFTTVDLTNLTERDAHSFRTRLKRFSRERTPRLVAKRYRVIRNIAPSRGSKNPAQYQLQLQGSR